MLKLAHIALSVSDIDRAYAFYKKNFGFRCSEKFDIPGAQLKIYILKKDSVSLELFEFKKYRSLPQYRKDLMRDLKTVGVKHFALAVTDIKAAYKRLNKTRVKFATGMRVFENGLRYFFIKDPDGILIELMETPKLRA